MRQQTEWQKLRTGIALTADAQRKKVMAEFLQTTIEDLEVMRKQLLLLERGDASACNRLGNVSHDIAASAGALKLGVLQACARALQDLVAEDARVDAFFVQCVTSAVDAIALEVDVLAGLQIPDEP